jgi:hypothetical protein
MGFIEMELITFLEMKRYSKKYVQFVEEQGFDGIISIWESRLQYIFDTNYYFIEEYINDLSKRKIIAEILSNCEVAEEQHLERIKELDEIFKEKTLETKESITHYSGWGSDDPSDVFSNMLGFKVEKINKNWFYFRVPRHRMEEWGIINTDLVGVE